MAKWSGVWVLAAGLLAACGGATQGGSGAAGSAGSSGLDAGSAGSSGLDARSDSPLKPPADSGPIEAGVFNCNGMCCNGTTHYCLLVTAGASPMSGTPSDAGPGTCSDAGVAHECVPLPADCVGARSCACVFPRATGGACTTCNDQGGGITVRCWNP